MANGGLPAKHANDAKGDEDSEAGKPETEGYHETDEPHERGRIRKRGHGDEVDGPMELSEDMEKFGGGGVAK